MILLNFSNWLREAFEFDDFIDLDKASPEASRIVTALSKPNSIYQFKFKPSQKAGMVENEFFVTGNELKEMFDEMVNSLQQILAKTRGGDEELRGKVVDKFREINQNWGRTKEFLNTELKPQKKYKIRPFGGKTGVVPLEGHDPQLAAFIKEFSPHDKSYPYLVYPSSARASRGKFVMTGQDLKELLGPMMHVREELSADPRSQQKVQQHRKYLPAIKKFVTDPSNDMTTFVVDTDLGDIF
jgi:hypothetical protein